MITSRGLPRTLPRGFASLGLILLLVIGLAALGGAGWWINQAQTGDMSERTAANTATSTAQSETTRDVVPPAGWTIYTDSELSFVHPAEWKCSRADVVRVFRICRVDGKIAMDFYPRSNADGDYAGQYWVVGREAKVGSAIKNVLKSADGGLGPDSVIKYEYSIDGEIYWSVIGFGEQGDPFMTEVEAESIGDQVILSIH